MYNRSHNSKETMERRNKTQSPPYIDFRLKKKNVNNRGVPQLNQWLFTVATLSAPNCAQIYRLFKPDILESKPYPR